MLSNNKIIENYIDHYIQIIERCDSNLLDKIRLSTEVHSKEISRKYFEVLYETEGGRNIFTKELIDEELSPKLAAWLPSLFKKISDKKEIIDYINLQLAVGKKYVRMNVPPHLLNLGSRVLKYEICRKIINVNFKGKNIIDAHTQIMMLVDLCLSITYEAYIGDKVLLERNSQALQNHFLGSELAEMCQHTRADMHNWHSLMLNKILTSNDGNLNALPSIKKSEFSLWLRHKANVFFNNNKEIESINDEIDLIEKKSLKLIKSQNSKEKVMSIIEEIDEHIKQVSWLLTSLTESARTLDSGRDTLTKLYNRRYLEVILQKESQLAINHDQSFLILMIDIDNFKIINDKYGHMSGDKVIGMVANTLYESIRTSDYIFRYGGDEFLILLIDTELQRGQELADQLISDIHNKYIEMENGLSINTSVSIGLAKSGSSSDFSNIISMADKALLDAKANGRNCYSIA